MNKMGKKTRVRAKIGTKSSTVLVLWNDKAFVVGAKILAMEQHVYDQLHSHYKRLKKCNSWKEYRVREWDGEILRVDL